MSMLSPKRLLVLRELGYINEHHPMAGAGDGWLRAFHVRYFRGPGDSLAAKANMSLDAVQIQLGHLAKGGYVDKRDKAQEYRINDKGRAVLAAADELHTF